jgi:hypothetical protein
MNLRLVEKQSVCGLLTQEQIFFRRQLWHEREFLKHGIDAMLACLVNGTKVYFPAVEDDPARSWTLDARNKRDQRRFTSAILTEEDMHLAAAQIKVDVHQCLDAREPLRDTLQR